MRTQTRNRSTEGKKKHLTAENLHAILKFLLNWCHRKALSRSKNSKNVRHAAGDAAVTNHGHAVVAGLPQHRFRHRIAQRRRDGGGGVASAKGVVPGKQEKRENGVQWQ